MLKPASNLLSPCISIARLGKRDMLIKNPIFIRNTLGGAVSYCTRYPNDFGKRKCAHVSLLFGRRVSVTNGESRDDFDNVRP